MKRVKLINDPAELVALFRAVDSKERRDVLTTLAEGWTMISDLVSKHGEGAYAAITYFEKFKLVESRWEVNNDSGRPEKGYRTFYNAFQISTSLTFDETQELLTKSVRILENGQKDFLFNNFCDTLLTKTIVDGLPFPPTNLVKMRELPMSEVSVILGEILKIIPLESYFSNLGMNSLEIPKA